MSFFQGLEEEYGKDAVKKCGNLVFLNKFQPKEVIMSYSKPCGYVYIFLHGKIK